MKRPVVAIDGPAGAGKSTVTRQVAERLGYTIVDTGALYRAVAYAAQQAGLSFEDAAGVGALSHELSARNAIAFDTPVDGTRRVLLDGVDVSLEIRSLEIAQGASKVSAIPAVRAALLEMQRAFGARGGVVLEGRDIGTVVFPSAEAKFYLTASVDVRAERRYRELIERGDAVDPAQVKQEVQERDRRDSSRPVAPLKRAPDAELIDSSSLSIEEVVTRIVDRVRRLEAESSSNS